jgi:uncharacterized protein YndB with AHSA1/START domain
MGSTRHYVEINRSDVDLWSAWTKPEQISSWHADRARGRVASGGTLTLEWEGLNFSIDLDVVECQPKKKLVLRDRIEGKAPQTLTVAFSALDSKRSRLELVHDGLPDAPSVAATGAGWDASLQVLKLALENYRNQARIVTTLALPVTGSQSALFASMRDLPNQLDVRPRFEVASETAPQSILFSLPDFASALLCRWVSLDGREHGSKLVVAQLSSWGAPPPDWLAVEFQRALEALTQTARAPNVRSDT